jgi:hypothetical protein
MSSAKHSPDDVMGTSGDEAAASGRAHGQDRGQKSDDIWPAIVARIGELREYASYYVAANVDRLRLSGRVTLMWSILAMVGGLAVVSVFVTASVLLVIGLATGVGQLLQGRTWLGQLIVSAAILLVGSGGVWLVLYLSLRKYQRSLVEKYELRKKDERTEYGTDIHERAKQRSQRAEQPVR